MHSVVFVDTSVMCNLARVPFRDQDAEEIIAEMSRRTKEEGALFILPITTVIETGNHIAQVQDGYQRRKTAERFVGFLKFIIAGQTPWVLHDVAWNKEFLQMLIDGAGSGVSFLDHSTSKVGAGDLCILAERNQYTQRTGVQASIWTLDTALDAYNI